MVLYRPSFVSAMILCRVGSIDTTQCGRTLDREYSPSDNGSCIDPECIEGSDRERLRLSKSQSTSNTVCAVSSVNSAGCRTWWKGGTNIIGEYIRSPIVGPSKMGYKHVVHTGNDNRLTVRRIQR